jgi:hypothetical protein
MAFADTALPRDPNAVLDIMTARSKLLHKGISIAGVCSRLVSQFLAYQVQLQLPFKKRCIEPLARLLELCKVLEAALKRYSAPAADAISHVQRELVRSILESVMPVRLKITTLKRADPSHYVISASTELVESIVLSTESWNAGRRIMLRLGVAACAQKAGLGSQENAVVAVEDRMRDLALLADYQQLARRACDCSVIYWVRALELACAQPKKCSNRDCLELVLLYLTCRSVRSLQRSSALHALSKGMLLVTLTAGRAPVSSTC